MRCHGGRCRREQARGRREADEKQATNLAEMVAWGEIKNGKRKKVKRGGDGGRRGMRGRYIGGERYADALYLVS